MNWPLKVQGRFLYKSDIKDVQALLQTHPEWGRTRLSEILCQKWNWQRPDGQWKDMACRELLRKLERHGLIMLPPRRSSGAKCLPVIADIQIDRCAVHSPLSEVQPIQVTDAREDVQDERLFNYLLKSEHYLGFSRPVGQNMKYLVRSADDVVLGCLLFGAAAWKIQDRDQFIDWDAPTREKYLNLLTNNTRFLILPWIRIPCLGSHVVAEVMRRLPSDWERRYGTQVVFVETFVDRSRFSGTCYQAANFMHIGQTQGRSRQDRYSRLNVPVKDIFAYPLCRNFRQHLGVRGATCR
jgi:hypothetical protein